MMAFIKFMNDSGVVGWVILATGMGVLFLALERAKSLYKDYGMNVTEFTGKIHNLILAKNMTKHFFFALKWKINHWHLLSKLS